MTTELVDHLHEGHGIELRAAVPLREAELEEASFGEHLHDLVGQAPQRLSFVGVGAEDGPERTSVVEQGHAAAGSWGMPNTRSAMMLRCTSAVPPPIVRARANR